MFGICSGYTPEPACFACLAMAVCGLRHWMQQYVLSVAARIL